MPTVIQCTSSVVNIHFTMTIILFRCFTHVMVRHGLWPRCGSTMLMPTYTRSYNIWVRKMLRNLVIIRPDLLTRKKIILPLVELVWFCDQRPLTKKRVQYHLIIQFAQVVSFGSDCCVECTWLNWLSLVNLHHMVLTHVHTHTSRLRDTLKPWAKRQMF